MIDETTIGEQTLDLFQRVARPWHYMDEGYAYDERAWSFVDDNGLEHSGYEIVRSQVEPSLAPPQPPHRGASDALWERTTSLPADAPIVVLLKTTFHPQPLPLVPRRQGFPEAVIQAAAQQRDLVEQQNRDDFQVATLGLTQMITDSVGTLDFAYPMLGWIKATVPAASVGGLSEREDVLATLVRQPAQRWMSTMRRTACLMIIVMQPPVF